MLIFELLKSIEMKHLTKEQRYVIASLHKRGESQESIADEIGVHRSTISRELTRNLGKRGAYNPEKAHQLAQERKERFASQRRFTKQVEKRIRSCLEQEQWSPEEIVGYYKKHNIDMVSVERIYQFIRKDKAKGGCLYKHLRHQLKHRKRPIGDDTKVKIKDRVSIEQRPEIANNRTEFGHWEADLIEGKNHKGFMLTITERVSKHLMMCYLPEGKKAEGVAKAMINLLLPYKDFVQSITMDNGLEFAAHKIVAKKLNTDTYFTHPYSSWEKGQIEYMNKLIRQYYPKKQPINKYNTKNINEIQRKINNRPRKNLNYNKPFELFYKFVKESCIC
jgi:IS30 family transposase